MRGLSNLVVTLLLLTIVVPASVLLVSKVREYAEVVRSESLPQPVTLAAYLLKNSSQDLLIVCNYGQRIIKNVHVVGGAGGRVPVTSSIEPKTCYLASLPAGNWYSVVAENQVVSVLRVS